LVYTVQVPIHGNIGSEVRCAQMVAVGNKLSLLAQQLLVFDAQGWAQHDFYDVFARSRADLERYSQRPLSEADLLVLGCGYNYPDVLLYAPSVRSASGVDVLPAYYRDGLGASLRAAWSAGGHRGYQIAAALGRRVHFRRYYRHLARLTDGSLDHRTPQIESYDGTHLPWADEHFDLVISNAVFEHVAECPAVVADLARVTRPGGISYHLWHNYFSYTGGHQPPRLCAQAPWGHLRGIHHKSGLNRLRPSEIERAFSERFEILDLFSVDTHHQKRGVDADYQPDHADALTPEIERELAEYDQDLLLTRAYLIVARKPA